MNGIISNLKQTQNLIYLGVKMLQEKDLIGQDNTQMVNQIILGDCLVAMEHIEDKSIDMILADLPYS